LGRFFIWPKAGEVMQRELKDKILNEIAAGATPQQCADKYNIPAGTIRSWVSRSKKGNVATKTATQRVKECNATPKRKKVNLEPVVRLEDVSEELTEKQRLFCFYYIRNFNATMAAIRAGYSTESAGVIGYENLTKPQIKAEINRLKLIRAESLNVTPDDIIERYMKIAFADMTDFTEFGTKEEHIMDELGIPVVDENGKPLMTISNYLNFNDFRKVDGGLICEISKGKAGMKIKLEDRQKALDWLARYFEMNPVDKHRQHYDEEKLKLERERLELERSKLNKNDDPNEEKEDDGLISALTAKAGEVWADENSDA
jgi:phage terminase small subunit